jgi:hypothetical protein
MWIITRGALDCRRPKGQCIFDSRAGEVTVTFRVANLPKWWPPGLYATVPAYCCAKFLIAQVDSSELSLPGVIVEFIYKNF